MRLEIGYVLRQERAGLGARGEFVMGAGLGVIAVTQYGAAPIGYAIGALGVMAAMSGVLGFCPACALVGRKLRN